MSVTPKSFKNWSNHPEKNYMIDLTTKNQEVKLFVSNSSIFEIFLRNMKNFKLLKSPCYGLMAIGAFHVVTAFPFYNKFFPLFLTSFVRNVRNILSTFSHSCFLISKWCIVLKGQEFVKIYPHLNTNNKHR